MSTPTANTAPIITVTPAAKEDTSTGMSGMTIGLIVGGIVLLMILIIVVFYVMKRRRNAAGSFAPTAANGNGVMNIGRNAVPRTNMHMNAGNRVN